MRCGGPTFAHYSSFSGPIPSRSQTGTASLSDRLTDPSGSAVPQAPVRLSNEGQRFTREAEAGETGFSRIAAIPSSVYGITEEAAGFEGERIRRRPIGKEWSA